MTADPLKPDTLLMWFKLESVLGRGGFGITYLATDTNLHTKVAIKEYLPGEISTRVLDSQVVPRDDEDRGLYNWGLTRFLEEARILAQFKHSNIVKVLTVFEANNTAYMVMEYERGAELASFLKNPLYRREDWLIQLFSQILDGLGEVHKKNIIHRDIKPANIFIRNDGTPVLLDFGSARQAVSGSTKNLTRVMTKGYAPYEQIDEMGGKQGPWTDIYSIGATLYYIVSGSLPTDSFSRFSQVIQKRPDPLQPLTSLEFQEQYSAGFLNAIDQALAFDAENRPQTVDALMQLLDGHQQVDNNGAVVRQESIETVIDESGSFQNSQISSKGLQKAGRPALHTVAYSEQNQAIQDLPNKENLGGQSSQKKSSRHSALLGVISLLVFIFAAGYGWLLLVPENSIVHRYLGIDSASRQEISGLVGTDGIESQMHDKGLAERISEEEWQKQLEAARIEEERQKQLEAARLEEERQKQLEAARLEEERQKQLEAARLEEERQKQLEAARLEEERQKQLEAARLEEERQKQLEAARLEEERQKQLEAARLEEEQQKQLEAARLEEERQKQLEAARLERARQQGKAGIDIMNERIGEFAKAMKDLDIDLLRQITRPTAKTSAILDGISSRYVSSKISISQVSVSEHRGRAEARVILDSVFRSNGERVIPGSSWNTFELKMTKESGLWGILSW